MRLILIHHLASRTNARPNQIAKYLAKRGHEIHLVLWDVPYPLNWKNIKHNFSNSLKYKRYNQEKVIIHKIRRLPFFCPFINRIWFQSQVRKIFNNENIDLIISESYINELDPPKDLPIIYSLVDDFEAYAEFYGSLIYKLSFKLLRVHKTIKDQINRAKAVIVVSDLLRKYANRYNKKVFKITNGVESWVLDKKYNKRKYNFGNHSLVYVSGFDYWSQLPQILYAINEVKKEINDIKLVLVGDGYQIIEGKKIVNELGLENNVIFLGQINDREELFEIINSCSVCLNLSEKNKRQDSASCIKVFEYSALGKPIISTKLNEVKNLRFPNIIFYNTEEELIREIKKSFNLKFNKTKIKTIVRRYTWENIANNFERILYKKLK